VITATFATWLVQRVSEVDRASEAATVAHVEALTAEIRALRAEVAALADRAVAEKRPDTPR
jgi:voltage-gated potassium channel